MGEYQGRRRGRPDPEPGPEQYQEPDADYGATPYRHYESYDEGHGYPADNQPNEYYAADPNAGYAEQTYPGQGYVEEYEGQYYDRPDQTFAFPEQADRDLGYAEPRFEGVYRHPLDEPYAERDFAHDLDRDYDPELVRDHDGGFDPERGFDRDDDRDFDNDRALDRDRDNPRNQPRGSKTDPSQRRPREQFPALTTPIATAAAAVALLAASFITPQAVAVVTAALQATVALAVLTLLDLPGRRALVIAVLPAVAGDAGTFAYSPDVGATAVAAAIGCGFVLAAADTVLTSRRRGVVPGASRDLASAAVALVFTGMTGLYVAAARLDHLTVAGGAVLAAALALGAARSRTLALLSPGGTVLRSMAVGLPFATAAVASYAAAILVA